MDNNNNFEQQFKQNVKSASMSPAIPAAEGTNKLPLIIAIILAVITLVESIVLIITLNNYFSLVNDDDYMDYEEGTDYDSLYDGVYSYDEDYNLIGFNLSCIAEDGSSYTFTTENQYEQNDDTNSLVSSGSYTIENSSLVSLTGSDKVLYYDGLDVADGLTIYTCNEVPTEADTDDTSTE